MAIPSKCYQFLETLPPNGAQVLLPSYVKTLKSEEIYHSACDHSEKRNIFLLFPKMLVINSSECLSSLVSLKRTVSLFQWLSQQTQLRNT